MSDDIHTPTPTERKSFLDKSSPLPDRFYSSPSVNNSRWGSPPQHNVYPNRKPVRQSSYIISVISERQFLQKGAQPLNYGIYYIPQEYKGTPDAETVALVGIPMLHISSFFEESSELIEHLRTCPALSYIDNIEEINCNSTCEILAKFRGFFERCDSDSLLLLNIEPKGDGKYKRWYPHPKFTLPGGRMEDIDCNDFFQCALREFKEETHLDLHDDNFNLIMQKKIIRDSRSSKKKHTLHFSSYKSLKTVSMFFAIRIRY